MSLLLSRKVDKVVENPPVFAGAAAPVSSEDSNLKPAPSSLAIKNPYFKSLALLHVLIYGGFATLAISTSFVMVRWEIISEMIRLDRLSAAAQTREEWAVFQNQISAYLWKGEFVTGGWVVALLYVALLLLTFTICWVVVNMTSVRIVSLKRPIGAFDAFIFITPNLLAGLIPYIAMIAIACGILISRVLPKFTNAELYTGSWKVLDVVGALPIAAIFSLILAIAWMFLIPMAVLSSAPSRAWITSPRLVLSMPGYSVGRWITYSLLSLIFMGVMALTVQQIASSFSLTPLALAVLSGSAFVIAMASTTWVAIRMLRLWQAIPGEAGENDESPGEISFSIPEGGLHFQTEQAEWAEGEVGEDEVPIYIPTLDGEVITLESTAEETGAFLQPGEVSPVENMEVESAEIEDDLYPLSSFPIPQADSNSLATTVPPLVEDSAIQDTGVLEDSQPDVPATDASHSTQPHRIHRKSAPPLTKKKTAMPKKSVKAEPVPDALTVTSMGDESANMAISDYSEDVVPDRRSSPPTTEDSGGENASKAREENPPTKTENKNTSLRRKMPPKLRKR